MTGADPTTEFSPSLLAIETMLRSAIDADCDLSVFRVDDLLGQAGWDCVTKRATAERVAPLLYRTLQDEAAVPATVQSRLYQAYRLSAFQNQLLFEELASVLALLAKAGIPVLVLKGAALAATLYGRPALRPMDDIDLLIAPDDAMAAIDALATTGYVAMHSAVHPDTDLIYENEIALVKTNDGHSPLPDVMLELHWSLLDSPFYQQTLPMDWFWQTATPFQIEGVATRMLGIEAQLLHLCAHLMLHHRGQGLLWMHDIALLLQKERVDWRVVVDRSVSLQLVLAVRHVLRQLAVDWGAPIPSAVLAELDASVPTPAEARVFAWLTAENRSVARRFGADLWSLPARQRLGFAWRHLFPRPAYIRQRYGASNPLVTPLLYLYRWYLGVRSLFGISGG